MQHTSFSSHNVTETPEMYSDYDMMLELIGNIVNDHNKTGIFNIQTSLSIENVKDLLKRLITYYPSMSPYPVQEIIRKIEEEQNFHLIKMNHEMKRLMHAKEQDMLLELEKMKEEEATKRLQMELKYKYSFKTCTRNLSESLPTHGH